MDAKSLLEFMALAEKLKCNTRHSWTSSGRRESVAEHTFRLGIFAWLVKDEFPDIDMERVGQLCLFHDMGEAVTGDVPSFYKKDAHRKKEAEAWKEIVELLPQSRRAELQGIFEEIEKNETKEANLLQALDKMEAVIQHNEASLDSWLPLEYELQLTYGEEKTEVFPYTKELRKRLREDSLQKIEDGKKKGHVDGDFSVSCDKSKLQLPQIMKMLKASYWGDKRSTEKMEQAILHSKCYGIYDTEHIQVGFARVVTDYTTSYYLCDVMIEESYRGKGLGRKLIEAVIQDEELQGLYGMLHTKDAQKFYQKLGFEIYQNEEEEFMKRKEP